MQINACGKVSLVFSGLDCIFSALQLLVQSFTPFLSDMTLKASEIGATLYIQWFVEVCMLLFGGFCFFLIVRPSPKLVKIHLIAFVVLFFLQIAAGVLGFKITKSDVSEYSVAEIDDAENHPESELLRLLMITWYAFARLLIFIFVALVNGFWTAIYRCNVRQTPRQPLQMNQIQSPHSNQPMKQTGYPMQSNGYQGQQAYHGDGFWH